jgi:hypothetical protein
MIRSANSGGHLAHLGGALWGLYSIYMLKKGKDLSTWLTRIPSIRPGIFSKRKQSGFRNIYTSSRPVSDDEYNFHKAQNQKQIDEILDKISKSGYDSLTREEKELLFKTSNKNQ